MKKLLLILALAVMCSSVARAEHFDDIADGMEAYLKEDYATALKLWGPLAERDVMIQFLLGMLYATGLGIKQNHQEAVEWHRIEAEQGIAFSQVRLGMLYFFGNSLIRDSVRGYMWVSLGASNGDENGNKVKDIMAKEMTPAQISKAQDMARDCLKKSYKNCY
ncbi:sel1 repeat family protein [Nitrosomonadaceae bacterium]|nr:sel1 repeat family protein [Nitrosomonadaceae bacterium]